LVIAANGSQVAKEAAVYGRILMPIWLEAKRLQEVPERIRQYHYQSFPVDKRNKTL
jgi:hypothetical protein